MTVVLLHDLILFQITSFDGSMGQTDLEQMRSLHQVQQNRVKPCKQKYESLESLESLEGLNAVSYV